MNHNAFHWVEIATLHWDLGKNNGVGLTWAGLGWAVHEEIADKLITLFN